MNRSFTKSEFFAKKIHPVLIKFPFYECLLLKRKSYLKSVGWFRSFRTGQSVDLDGKPIPWFTYGAIELLEERIPASAIVFEYGCGWGTQWWAEKTEAVDAVEHDIIWYEEITAKLPENVRVWYRELGIDYENAISESGRIYDIIVVDGKNRTACCEKSLLHLAENGVFILDDTDRIKQQDAIKLLKEKGFRQLRFRGFSPIEFMECETSIFYRDGNLLAL
ncbi:MAG TPA: hypothetical protein VKM36_03865 [Balneolaceae bacterium]|nr:hypothetical protein [Balneolaceae bacterium]